MRVANGVMAASPASPRRTTWTVILPVCWNFTGKMMREMGKTQSPQDKAAELRHLIRAANEVLGDLRRAMREATTIIESAFEERVSASVRKANETISSQLVGFGHAMKAHNDACQQAVMDRWKYIETACVASPEMANLIALYVLRKSGGTVDTSNAKVHLVTEYPEKDGTSTFAFPQALIRRAEFDKKTEAAIRDAVEQHRPDIKLMPVHMRTVQKGINEE